MILAYCFLVNFNAYAESNDDPWTVLQKAAVAARALSYQGVFVCQTAQQSKSVQITHHFDGKNEFARNVLLDGSPREVLSQGGDLVIYNPKNEKVVIEKRRGQNMFPAILPINLEDVKASYTLRTGGIERVAGRQAQMLMLEPKDGLRYRYKFWVDTEYGILLKSVMLNQRDELLESIGFNQLSLLNTVALDWFKPNIDRSKNYVMEQEPLVIADNNERASWIVKGLPAGYHKVDQMTRMVQGKPYPITHLIFSDGLASVSLFIEPLLKGAKTNVTLNTSGNTSFYVNVNSGHLITVMGEVPEATLVQIANAVVFRK
ncbi:MAG: transcriptional regulator [Methylotenera sp.]|nr:transcriptional regulator [Methylotenera sp.]